MPTHPAPTQAGRLQIAPNVHQILFRDGSSIGLHRVYQHGTPATLLRAVEFADSFIVFDLEGMDTELGKDLRGAPARDVAGLVFYGLRSRFANRDELLARAMNRARKAILMPAPEAFAKEPA